MVPVSQGPDYFLAIVQVTSAEAARLRLSTSPAFIGDSMPFPPGLTSLPLTRQAMNVGTCWSKGLPNWAGPIGSTPSAGALTGVRVWYCGSHVR